MMDKKSVANLSHVKRALLSIRQLKSKINSLEREPIAVVGMSCRFPKGANNPKLFWEMLKNGQSAITEIPKERWDMDRYFDSDSSAKGKIYTKFAHFLDHVDLFDAPFFGISAREAELMDPQQRLLLEVCWEAIENSGICVEDLQRKRTGVFIGNMGQDYLELTCADPNIIDIHTPTGTLMSVMAGRISYIFGLNGPSLTTDTACSSSLMTVHLACKSIRSGECDAAIVGGVGMMLTPTFFLGECRAQMLAPDGKCKTFDENANGYGRGEGCGIVLLKKLSSAVKDKDNILAVIRGSAMNHDGRSSGLMVPNPKAQEEVVDLALKNAQVKPENVSYIEAHGTGTPLGDPIEISALTTIFGARRNPLFVGAVKTNIGHLEGAAGVASLIKVILMLQHKEIPKHLYFNSPNSRIPWDTIPFQVCREHQQWSTSENRIAGISSFGFSGTNVHLVVEESPALPVSAASLEQEHVFTISAKTQKALEDLAHSYQNYFTENPQLRINDICFTTNNGRSHFNHRLSILANSTEDLTRKIALYCNGKQQQEIFCGVARSINGNNKTTIPQELAKLYVEGHDINTQEIYSKDNAIKVSLPTYTFQRQRYWVEAPPKSHSFALPKISENNHPLFQLLLQKDLQKSQEFLDTIEKLSDKEAATLLHNLKEQQTQKIITRYAHLSPERRQIFELLTKQQDKQEHNKKQVAIDYYDSMSSLDEQAQELSTDTFLTFGIFPKAIRNFSWIQVQASPEKYKKEISLIVESQKKLRQLLFSNIDLANCEKVLDFGCGYGTDVISLAEKNPHLKLCGYTISPNQAKIANKKIQSKNLQQHVQVHNRNSAIDAFPDQYDLAFGFEVVHHILDKDALFKNISNHLREGGHLLLADFITPDNLSIDHEKTSSFFISKKEWARLLSQYNLLLVDGIDISFEVGNFLHDPNFEANLAKIDKVEKDGDIYNALISYNQLGKLLHKQLTQYSLLSIQKTTSLSHEELHKLNLDRLGNLLPYVQKSPSAWAYNEAWLKEDIGNEQKNQKGTWIIFADKKGIGKALASYMESLGHSCICVFSGTQKQNTENEWHIIAENPEHYQELFMEISQKESPCLGIVYLWGQDVSQPYSLEICDSLLYIIQKTTLTANFSPELWIVTAGAQRVTKEQKSVHIQQAPLWGMTRCIFYEFPELVYACYDMDDDADLTSNAELQALSAELCSKQTANQISRRNKTRYISKLESNNVLEKPFTIKINEKGSYLITGGLSGLGLMAAKWLVSKGAKHLTLISRSDPNTATTEVITDLQNAGVDIVVFKGDVSVRDDVDNLFKSLETPLCGVLHSAGILDDGILLEQTPQRFHNVMKAKIEGSWNLHYFTKDMPLDFFICFSSISSMIGGYGQANYAAANAFMDALCYYRNQQGLCATTINWGIWDGGGMTANLSDIDRQRFVDAGMGTISTDEGLRILEKIIGQQITQVMIAPVVWSKFSQYLSRKMAFLDEFLPIQVKTSSRNNKMLAQLSESSKSERKQIVTDYLVNQVARIVRAKDINLIKPYQGFFDLGFDSLMAVELRNILQNDLNCSLSSTLTFKYTSIQALADHLLSDILIDDNCAQIEHHEYPQEKIKITEVELIPEEEKAAALLREKLNEINQWIED